MDIDFAAHLVSLAIDRVVCLPTSNRDSASSEIEQIRYATEAVVIPIVAEKHLRLNRK
jgi:hypothetical protein